MFDGDIHETLILFLFGDRLLLRHPGGVSLPAKLPVFDGDDRGDRQQRQHARQRDTGDRGMTPDQLPTPFDPGDRTSADRFATEESTQIVGQVRPGRVAARGILSQALEANCLEVPGNLRQKFGGWHRFVTDHLHHGVHGVRRPKRRSAGQALVQDRPERVDVGGRAHDVRSALGLFGGHVAGRAQNGAGRGEALGGIASAGEAEVGDLGRAVLRHQDVRWLEITVNRAGPVGDVDRLRQAQNQPGRFERLHRLPVEPVRQ